MTPELLGVLLLFRLVPAGYKDYGTGIIALGLNRFAAEDTLSLMYYGRHNPQSSVTMRLWSQRAGQPNTRDCADSAYEGYANVGSADSSGCGAAWLTMCPSEDLIVMPHFVLLPVDHALIGLGRWIDLLLT
jgi:hypothetical protein